MNHAIDNSGRRRVRSRVWAALGAVVLSTTLVPAPDGHAATTSGAGSASPSAAAAAAPAMDAAGGRWVTLLTGDRVLVAERDGEQEVLTVQPGPGRTDVRFQVYADAGETFVVPSDALALVGRGLVDRRLFDVSALVRFGYDDESRSDVPLIVAGTSAEQGDTAATLAEVSVAGATVTGELASVAAVAVREDKATATDFWVAVTAGSGPAATAGELAPALTKIWLDGPVQSTLDHSVAQIGAPTAWEAGHTGGGAVVAVLDSGIDGTHPDLADAVVATRDFTGNPAGTQDGQGHGTHVASIVTGNGAASGGTYAGVAPDAGLLVGKVLDDNGGGSESQVIEGMEWAATQAPVVNMSLGSPLPGDGTEVMDQAVDRLTDETGALFVVAAGNSGPDAQSVSSPGTAAAALTVGAVDDHDDLADFSSRGPRRSRPAIKPDITAPGVDIAAARAEGTDLGHPLDEDYTRLSGTSMAAPHVAGAAAILAGQHPDWEAGQLKAALVGSATPRDGLTVYEQGAGRLDVGRADTQPVYATPASADAGVARWPHDDDEPVATTVTYHNHGTSPLDLDLSLDVDDPTGTPAVDGMFTVSPARLTVPPGGSAPATLTVDTTGAGPDGLYGGVLTATGDSGRVTVRTPVGITKEVESYDVTVQLKDHGGAPTDRYALIFVDIDQPQLYLPYDPSGTVVVRLPAGEYFSYASVGTKHGDDRSEGTIAVEPTFVVSGDSTLVVDAREGRPVGTTVDERDAGTGQADVSFRRLIASGDYDFTYILNNFDDFYLRPSVTRAPAGQFTFAVRAVLARPDDAGGFDGSPYLYHVRWSQDRKVPTRLVRHVADRDLAVVTSTHATASGSTTGVRDDVVTVTVPGTLTEYYTPGVPWVSSFSGDEGQTYQRNVYPGRTFRRGRHYEERWNGAVLGPADPSTLPLVQRAQDELLADVPLFSDQDPNHIGFSSTDSGSTTLHRDGELIGESPGPGYGLFTVPAGEGSYRLATSATRSISDLSTRVDVAWTFRSAHVDGDEPVALPIMGIRFAPRLDDHNRAPSGRRFTFPVEVRRHADADYGTLRSLTVDVSYDDGRTWRTAPLTGAGDERTVTVTHPRSARYVSLRARATDSAGNRVEQTIIHAYALVR